LGEYYYNSRLSGELKTDEEYYSHLRELADGYRIEAVIVDPSAASFLECIRRHGTFRVIPGKNDVIRGIQRVTARRCGKGDLFCQCCAAASGNFPLPLDENSARDVRTRKTIMHGRHRYFVMTVLERGTDFFCRLRRPEFPKYTFFHQRRFCVWDFLFSLAGGPRVTVQTARGEVSPSAHRGIYPSEGTGTRLYYSIREGVPIIDAAIPKIVHLIGSFSHLFRRAQQKAHSEFWQTERVGPNSLRFLSFLASISTTCLPTAPPRGDRAQQLKNGIYPSTTPR
jgi:hypothetical protein